MVAIHNLTALKGKQELKKKEDRDLDRDGIIYRLVKLKRSLLSENSFRETGANGWGGERDCFRGRSGKTPGLDPQASRFQDHGFWEGEGKHRVRAKVNGDEKRRSGKVPWIILVYGVASPDSGHRRRDR